MPGPQTVLAAGLFFMVLCFWQPTIKASLQGKLTKLKCCTLETGLATAISPTTIKDAGATGFSSAELSHVMFAWLVGSTRFAFEALVSALCFVWVLCNTGLHRLELLPRETGNLPT